MYVCMYIYVCMYVHVWMYEGVYISVYVCMFKDKYIFTQTGRYTYIHTQTYTLA